MEWQGKDRARKVWRKDQVCFKAREGRGTGGILEEKKGSCVRTKGQKTEE